MSNYLNIVEQINQKVEQCGRLIEEITLIAVTKYQDLETIKGLYQLGCRNFGESRLQVALPKIEVLPQNAKWHFIGSLQSKKVAKVVAHFDLIHSVDSLELAQKISEASLKLAKKTSILLQVNTSGELSKQGLRLEEWQTYLNDLNELEGIKLEGLMTMAPLTTDQVIIRECFKKLCQLKQKWVKEVREPHLFHHLSMGMSNDYSIALEEGATLLRIGTLLF